MTAYTPEKLAEIIEDHRKWRLGLDGGNRADLAGAKLTWAELNGANLTRANLNGVDLTGARLNGAKLNGEIITIAPVIINGLTWIVTIGDTRMKIGCQLHTIKKWKQFKDSTINQMDAGAIKFWEIWKEPLLAMCDAHTSLIPVKTEEESTCATTGI